MKIGLHKTFDKQFARLTPPQKQKAKEAIILFKNDPYNQKLRNHPLKGPWSEHHSISAGGDLRLHYISTNKEIALFVAIGTHSQLYK